MWGQGLGQTDMDCDAWKAWMVDTLFVTVDISFAPIQH